MNLRRRGSSLRGTLKRTVRRDLSHGLYCAMTLAVVALLVGCATIAPGRSRSGNGASTVEGTDDTEEEAPLFQTSEDYWVQTPWFSVSSIIIRVRTTQPRTVIVLPESSVMRDYMTNDRNVVFDADSIPHRMRFLFGLGIKTGDIDPFFDPDRIDRP